MSVPENAKLYTAAGAAALGLATGLAASYNVLIIPLINASRVKTGDKLTLWHQGYLYGKAIMIPLPLAGATILAATAYSLRSFPISRTLALAAALGTGHILTTLGFMLPTNNRLMALEKQESHSVPETDEVDKLVEKWTILHGVRVAWLAVATATAFTALVRL